MQRLVRSNAIATASVQPLVVVDAATLARVSGGAGPHGGWAVPAPDASSSAMRAAAGPHGGWRVTLDGPHGGW